MMKAEMMEITKSNRGFPSVSHPVYPPEKDAGTGEYAGLNPPDRRIVTQSSMIGNYPDAMQKPGSSYLWVGFNHHLNREEIRKLIGHMQKWLETGEL